MTTMRVFLHDLPWQQDAAGFRARIDQFLDIADEASHPAAVGAVRLVLGSAAEAGPAARADPGRAQLRLGAGAWREGVVGSGAVPAAEGVRHGRRRRVREGHARARLGRVERAGQRQRRQLREARSRRTRSSSCWRCCRRCSQWAREAGAEQPLTSGVWKGDWSSDDKLSPMERIQLEQSDVISFHNYDSGAGVREAHRLAAALASGPILCTEYMARGNGSTFQGSLPVAKKYNVGADQLGLRRGQDADLPAVGFVEDAVRAIASRRCGSTKSSRRTARRTSRTKWT